MSYNGGMEGVVMAAGVLLWRGSAETPEFLVLRNARHGSWGLPKGHLEPGEDLLAGALRECREETGIALAAGDLAAGFADAGHYRTPDGQRKRVVMFLAAAGCDETRVRVSREHAAIEWWSVEQAVERLAFEELRRCVVRAAVRLRASAGATAR